MLETRREQYILFLVIGAWAMVFLGKSLLEGNIGALVETPFGKLPEMAVQIITTVCLAHNLFFVFAMDSAELDLNEYQKPLALISLIGAIGASIWIRIDAVHLFNIQFSGDKDIFNIFLPALALWLIWQYSLFAIRKLVQ